MSIDIEKQEANWRIIYKYDDYYSRWHYVIQKKRKWFNGWKNVHWAVKFERADELLKQYISQTNPTIIKELYVK